MTEKEAWLFLLDRFEEHPKENDYNCGGLCGACKTLFYIDLIDFEVFDRMLKRISKEVTYGGWFDFDPEGKYLPHHQLLRSGKCRQYAEMCDK